VKEARADVVGYGSQARAHAKLTQKRCQSEIDKVLDTLALSPPLAVVPASAPIDLYVLFMVTFGLGGA
jgi:hypothetical protein